ncbi:unnamed protein product [Danaus chrysippus]|uniref:(African queen) hypothetical protein n=1 Tax=Danaus chrysippus TaxID=151541 RepID=A0A8J2QJM0_9NEOP|nr:unnamed protein product [Danaus chrysippus]
MATTATRQIKSSNSANILMCKQWWKVCWMYGDQEKYYRQLYGRRKVHPTTYYDDTRSEGARATELSEEFFEEYSNQDPAQDETCQDKRWFGVESEPIYGFNRTWTRDQRRRPIQNYDQDELEGDAGRGDTNTPGRRKDIHSDTKTTDRRTGRTRKSETELPHDGKTFPTKIQRPVKPARKVEKDILQPLQEEEREKRKSPQTERCCNE